MEAAFGLDFYAGYTCSFKSSYLFNRVIWFSQNDQPSEGFFC